MSGLRARFLFYEEWCDIIISLKYSVEDAMSPITVETLVSAPLDRVWEAWTSPEHIVRWCFASDDWEAPFAENDLRVDGKFITRMAAKDGSVGFDFGGVYTEVEDRTHIAYTMEDGRKVVIDFFETPDGVRVVETFDPEALNPMDMQRNGWQAILDNFKKYAEGVAGN